MKSPPFSQRNAFSFNEIPHQMVNTLRYVSLSLTTKFKSKWNIWLLARSGFYLGSSCDLHQSSAPQQQERQRNLNRFWLGKVPAIFLNLNFAYEKIDERDGNVRQNLFLSCNISYQISLNSFSHHDITFFHIQSRVGSSNFELNV